MKISQNNQLTHLAEIKISYSHKIPPSELPQVSSSISAYELFKQAWDSDTIELVESAKALLLNRNNKVLGIMSLSTGGRAGTIIDIPCLFAAAIKANAHGIILCHNHPSSNLKPSKTDKELTQKIKKASKLLDISLLDHLILTSESYYSMADNGDM